MKKISMHINMTFEAFVERFRRDVTERRRIPRVYNGLALKDEFRGYIDEEKSTFWFQKTRPRFAVSGFHRHFEENITKDESGVTITGKNTYGRRRGIVFLLIYIFYTIGIILAFHQSLWMCGSALITLNICLPGATFVRNLINKREDQAVIEYLEALRDEFADRGTESL